MYPITRHRTNWFSNDWMDREFGRMVRHMFGDGGEETRASTYPVNMWEDDNALHVEAEMPGFTRDQIDITIDQGALQISATHKEQEEHKDRTPVLTERRWSSYFRSLPLSAPVREEDVQARYEDGVLHLTLPKSPEAKPRRITVS